MQSLFGLNGRLFRYCEIISRFAYVNILWIAFTILGLGVFGIMPATAAMFSVVRKWVMKELDIPIFKTFWGNYRKEFVRSNLIGLILFMIGYILYVDFALLPTGGLFTLLRIALMVVGLLFIIVLLYIFPIFAHYDWKKRLYIKYALILGSAHPHYTLLMVFLMGAIYYISMSFPGLIPFFSGSVTAYVMMWTAYQVIKRMEEVHAAKEIANENQRVGQPKGELLEER